MLGLWLLGRKPAWGWRVLALDLVLLYLLSLPPVAFELKHSLEGYPPLTPAQVEASGAQAIVVLGGGAAPHAPEYGEAHPHWYSLVRARYAGWLQVRTGLPVVVSGGGEGGAEGQAMQAVLGQLGVPQERIWVESRSLNTQQNASQARQILAEHGLGDGAGKVRVLLVTQAYHMRRSVWIFEKEGLEVVPAPCDLAFRGGHARGVYALLPQAESLFLSCQALEEWLANLFYRLRY